MRIIRAHYPNLPVLNGPCALTLGNFDGMHRGHQQLLKKLVSVAKERQLNAVVLTFEPHSKEYFNPGVAVPRLMRFREKYEVLNTFALDALIGLRFDKLLAALTAEEFVRDVLQQCFQVKAMVVGDDCCFGSDRQGTFSFLEKYGASHDLSVEQVPSVRVLEERVSSSRVRLALEQGDLSLAETLLGRPFFLLGRVAYGQQRGRSLGFPTANIFLHRALTPLQGVFVVCVKGIGAQDYYGVANVGERPTVGGKRVLLEVHLFNFDATIYGWVVRVEFLHKLRNEQRYDSLELLVQQIKIDVAQAEAYLDEKND